MTQPTNSAVSVTAEAVRAPASTPGPAATRSSYARIPSAVALQFAVKSNLVVVPLVVFTAAWVIAIGIGFWIHQASGRSAAEAAAEPMYTGASQAALWCLVFMAAYSASHTFPFSMALSYSRRVFVIGAFLAFGLVSLGFGVAFAAGAALEQLTNGFGVNIIVFDLPYLTGGPGGVFAAGILATVACLFLMMFGFFFSILFRRVTVTVFWTIMLALAAVLAVIVMLITQNGWWPEVWQWFVQQNALTLAAWLVVPLVVLTVVNYLVIRKATPTP